jgi:outer membrane receptor protein involved in Fe transport
MKLNQQKLSPTLTVLTMAIIVSTVGVFVPAEKGWAIDEITVTTRRTEENVQDIPISVSTISNKQIELQGISSTKDIVKLIPGVQFDQGFASSDTRISIRGINNSRGRASVATLVDGIDISGENVTVGGGGSLINLELLDLERVEVIKGPQSALYGRNAFAGAINYITKKPNMDNLEIEVGGDVAEHGTYKVKGSISGPVIDNKLALRFNAATSSSDGYFNNNTGPSENAFMQPIDPGNNQDLNGYESTGARLSALWTPSDTLDISAAISYSKEEADQRAIAKVGVANTLYDFDGNALPSGTLPEFEFFGNQGYGQWLGTVDSVSESSIGLSNTGDGREFPGSEDERWLATLTIEKELDRVSFKSVSSYLQNDSSVEEDVEFQNGLGTFFMGVGLSLANDYVDDTDTEQLSQEFILESNDWERGRWLVGAQYFKEDVDNLDNSSGWYNDPATAFALPCGNNQGTAPGFVGSLSCSYFDATNVTTLVDGQPITQPIQPKQITRDTTSYSLFALVGFDFTDNFSGTLEARYIKDEIEVSTNTLIDRVSQYLLHVPPDLDSVGLLPATDKVTTESFNPRVSLDYRFNDASMIYVSAAKGTKPGGFGTSQMSRPQASRMDEEELLAYEIGSKNTLFDGALRANAAIFFNDYKDRQVGVTVTDLVSGWPSAGIVNAASAETKGLEIDLTWLPTDELTFGLAYAYTDAEWTDFNYTNIRAAKGRLPTEKDKAICGNISGDCTGGEVAGIPEDALVLLANYTGPISGDFEWFINADARYQSERALNDQVNTAFVDSSWIADAQLGLQGSNWTVMIFADNVFDDDTVQWSQNYNDFRDGMYGGGQGGEPRDETIFAFLPDPRVIGVRANYRFDL